MNKDDINNQLKPCPFCGGKAAIHKGYRGILFIKCIKCGSLTSFDNDICNVTCNKAIDYWNRRAR